GPAGGRSNSAGWAEAIPLKWAQTKAAGRSPLPPPDVTAGLRRSVRRQDAVPAVLPIAVGPFPTDLRRELVEAAVQVRLLPTAEAVGAIAVFDPRDAVELRPKTRRLGVR